MELDLAINGLVEVKATGIHLGHRGRVVNRFARTHQLYAVELPVNCVGYFERSELKKVTLEQAATDWERGKGFHHLAVQKRVLSLFMNSQFLASDN